MKNTQPIPEALKLGVSDKLKRKMGSRKKENGILKCSHEERLNINSGFETK
jgi:hypothetical protein